jgi:hypothetical protein
MFAGTGRYAWTRECVDYAVWAINEYLERDIIDGIYFDDVSVGRTLSLASTGYDLPDGTRRLGFTALNQRRLLMRLWRRFLANGKEPDIGLHMTYCYEVPMFSFARYLFNGEVFARANFMDVWPPDRLRIMGGAAKWGNGIQWVTQFQDGAETPDKYWAYFQDRALAGNYMVADVLAEGVPLNDLLRGGMIEPGVRVYPFWQSGDVLALEAPRGANVVAAVYAHAGRAWVVVTNYENEEHEVTLTLHADRLFPGKTTGVAWRDIDPGLRPPVRRVASREERRRLAEGPTMDVMLGGGDAVDEEELLDRIEGVDPVERELRRLEFRAGRGPARVRVRPRDYRVLEARSD